MTFLLEDGVQNCLDKPDIRLRLDAKKITSFHQLLQSLCVRMWQKSSSDSVKNKRGSKRKIRMK